MSHMIVRRYPLLQMSSTHRWKRATVLRNEALRLLCDFRSGMAPARLSGSLSFVLVPTGPERELVLGTSDSDPSAASAVPVPALVLTRTGLVLTVVSSLPRLLLLLTVLPLDEVLFSSLPLLLGCLADVVSLDDLLVCRVLGIPMPGVELLLLIKFLLDLLAVEISTVSSSSPSDDGLEDRIDAVRLLVVDCDGAGLFCCWLPSASHSASLRSRETTRPIDNSCSCQWLDCPIAMLSAKLTSSKLRHAVSWKLRKNVNRLNIEDQSKNHKNVTPLPF